MTAAALSPSHERQSLHAYLNAKGELTALLAVVCVAAWLEEERGRGPFTTRELRQLYPRRDRPIGTPALTSPSDPLRRAAKHGLVECIGRSVTGSRETSYQLTELGRTVAAGLPDLRAVSEARGLQRAMPGAWRMREQP